jgi:hypothetical protein
MESSPEAANPGSEEILVRYAFPAAIVLLAFACRVHAATPPAPAPASSAVQACASDSDAENLCTRWDSAAGSHGRGCHLDVERIDRKYGCRYDAASVAEMDDHKPMCFSAARAEHILFESSRSRQFRVRRLVRITETGANGQACPRDPFNQPFHEEDFHAAWDTPKDSLAPKASAIGCRYKLEVQWNAIDANSPEATYDPQHRHLECRDPHLQITGGN